MQRKADYNETAPLISEHRVVSMDISDNMAFMEVNEAVDKTILAECAAVGTEGTMTLDTEELVPTKTFVGTEKTLTIDEIMVELIDDNKEKEVVILLETEATFDEHLTLDTFNMEVTADVINADLGKDFANSVKIVDVSAPTNGIFVLLSRRFINQCNSDKLGRKKSLIW